MFGMLVGAGFVILGAAALVHHRHGAHCVMHECAFRRLKATPQQKQMLKALFSDTQTRLSSVHERACALRVELADAFTKPTMEGKELETLEARLFEILGEGTQILREAVTRTHATLEPEQRRQLADWLRRKAHRHNCHTTCCP